MPNNSNRSLRPKSLAISTAVRSPIFRLISALVNINNFTTSLWNLYKKCIPYLSGIFSKLCSNKKKKVTMVSKHTLVQISLYPWLNEQLKFRTDMNSDASYESAVRTSLIPLHGQKSWGQLPFLLLKIEGGIVLHNFLMNIITWCNQCQYIHNLNI
jgi:hypothetical protein